MAFSVRNLSILAYAQGFTLWHYKADGEWLDAVGSPCFFADAADMLTAGDMMMVSATDGGRLLCVAANNDGVRTAPLC